MINWVIICLFFTLYATKTKQNRLCLVQGVTNLMFYFQTKKILEKYFLINQRFKFV